MDERAFLAWALGVFHAALLTLVVVLAAHAAGNLGGLLAAAGTMVGIAILLALWAIAWATAHEGLRGVSLDMPGPALGAAAVRAVKVGGLAGAGVVALVGV
jgi:hypothetical protein